MNRYQRYLKHKLPRVATDVGDWLQFRAPGKRVGLALGVFDYCHEGHEKLLRRAAAACDKLVVGVHTDENVIADKKVRPANSQLERMLAVQQLGIADRVRLFADLFTVSESWTV